MNFKKTLISGIGALTFMVILALNFQLVNSSAAGQSGGLLTLVELAAKAQGGGVECTSSYDCWDINSGDGQDPVTGEDLCCYAYAGNHGQARL